MSGIMSAAADVISGSAFFTTGSQVAWYVPMLIAAVAYYQYDLIDPEGRPKDIAEDRMFSEYDFIIVGAGSAGSVVANRLSEIGQWKILLLEAGGQETEISDVPIFAGYLQQSQLDWGYKTEPDHKTCLGLKEGRCCWPRGKVLGGSSVLNYMLYVRGNKKDYDSWEALGNKGWGYKDLLYYFKKSEDNQNPYLANTPYHSTGGYLTVGEAPYHSPLAEAFIQGGRELGYPNRDFNGEKQTGFMRPQGTIRHGSRCSTAKAFLRPARNRENLHISIHSHVTKILIDPNTKVAFGVEFVKNKMIHRVRARKEVILSAGAINSPQLLMLSGIGPKEELRKHGIPLIQDLSVGKNLQDHVASGGYAFLVHKDVAIVENRLHTISNLMEYAVMGEGPLTILGGVEGLAFINTKYANKTEDFPDIEFHFISGSVSSDGGEQIKKIQGVTDSLYDGAFRPINNKDVYGVLVMLLRPKSVGCITLRSANPYDYPYIYPKYYSDKDNYDMKVMIDGMKIALALSQTQAMQKFGARLNPHVFPACRSVPMYSDAYWECMLRQYTATVYHPVGTAKMGPYWDSEAVVDDELRVYGIKGLRVIDGSIMPNQVSGNTNAPIIMIGEKGSDLIKESWLKTSGPKYTMRNNA